MCHPGFFLHTVGYSCILLDTLAYCWIHLYTVGYSCILLDTLTPRRWSTIAGQCALSNLKPPTCGSCGKTQPTISRRWRTLTQITLATFYHCKENGYERTSKPTGNKTRLTLCERKGLGTPYSCKLGVTLVSSGILLDTLAYCWIPLHTVGYSCILLDTLAYCWILLHTAGYSCILLGTLAYCWVLLHTVGYSCILLDTLCCPC